MVYMSAISDWRWAVGHISVATINGSDAYLIENEPLQVDQSPGRPWLPPSDNGTQFPRPARVVTMLDGSRQADGFYTGQMSFAYLTEAQLSYLDTKFGWSDTVWSTDATIKVRTQTGVFIVLHVALYRPVPNEDFQRGERGAQDVIIRYARGVLAT